MERHAQDSQLSLYKFSPQVSFRASPLSGWYRLVLLMGNRFRCTLELEERQYSFHIREPRLFFAEATGELEVSGRGTGFFCEIQGLLLQNSLSTECAAPLRKQLLPEESSLPRIFKPCGNSTSLISETELLSHSFDGLLNSLFQSRSLDKALRRNYLLQILLHLRGWELQSRVETMTQTTNASKWTIQQIAGFIEEHYNRQFSLDELAEKCGLNSSYFSRAFHEEIGTPLFEYLNRLRIKQACVLLKNSRQSITDIAFAVGYNNITFFNRYFKRVTGMTPREFRR